MWGFCCAIFPSFILIGMLWNREWWKYAHFLGTLYNLLYNRLHECGRLLTGIVGSLDTGCPARVERGSQPEYYYALVQIQCTSSCRPSELF